MWGVVSKEDSQHPEGVHTEQPGRACLLTMLYLQLTGTATKQARTSGRASKSKHANRRSTLPADQPSHAGHSPTLHRRHATQTAHMELRPHMHTVPGLRNRAKIDHTHVARKPAASPPTSSLAASTQVPSTLHSSPAGAMGSTAHRQMHQGEG